MHVKKQILFVDDEPNFHAGLRRMLHDRRDVWEMRFAVSVDEAVAVAGEVELDVIVSDVRMPGKDGFDLLRLFARWERTEDVPVVILTGNAEDGLKRRALELGAADLLNKPVTREDLVARLNSVLRMKGYQDELKAQNAVLDLRVRERTFELESSRLDILFRLSKAAEYRDEETGNHVLRVGRYCAALAARLGLGDEFVERILLTAPLHDVGKIGIPDHVLLKRGAFDREEWAVMQTHCEIGAAILLNPPQGLHAFLSWRPHAAELARLADLLKQENPILAMASTIARAHHEKWNGEGYPRGLRGETIPLEARIAALADVYDALRSDRPYKEAFDEERTVETLRRGAGVHFDPALVEAFEAVAAEFDAIRNEFADALAAP